MKVVTEDGRDVEPGSGEIGMVAARRSVPLGYFKDPEKSARTFRVIDGVRYSLPGDWATVAADGSLILLGRGSNCINTGGEKVFPEEVEEAVKAHPAVYDCLVVGVPDERFGERVVAIASLQPGESADEASIIETAADHIARYKLPKRVLIVERVQRAANGKADYPWAREIAKARATTADVAQARPDVRGHAVRARRSSKSERSSPKRVMVVLSLLAIDGRFWMYWGEGTFWAATSNDLVHWSPLEFDATGDRYFTFDTDAPFVERASNAW